MAVVTAGLWGSYSPVVKMIYQIPGHPEPWTLTAVKQSLAGVVAVLVATPYANADMRRWGGSA